MIIVFVFQLINISPIAWTDERKGWIGVLNCGETSCEVMNLVSRLTSPTRGCASTAFRENDLPSGAPRSMTTAGMRASSSGRQSACSLVVGRLQWRFPAYDRQPPQPDVSGRQRHPTSDITGSLIASGWWSYYSALATTISWPVANRTRLGQLGTKGWVLQCSLRIWWN